LKVYTYSEARQQLASLLDEARQTGSVQITRRDGTVFVVTPEKTRTSPLDVPGASLGLSREEIVAAVREGRSRAEPGLRAARKTKTASGWFNSGRGQR
jgi:prevent-host-death family protein